jgi:hypothetical protein
MDSTMHVPLPPHENVPILTVEHGWPQGNVGPFADVTRTKPVACPGLR